MTEDEIALRELLEKGSDTTSLREMIGFAAERLMALETEGPGNTDPTLRPGAPPGYCGSIGWKLRMRRSSSWHLAAV
jgi:hypothetical protein